MPAPGALTVLMSRAARRGRGRVSGFIALILGGLLAAAASGATPSPQCLWTPPWLPRAAPPGMASIQYLLLSGSQIMDDRTAATIAQSLGPDRTLHFRYDKDWPDDHVFPNGVSMGQIHLWL